MNMMYSSDILRSIYSQCQTISQKTNFTLKFGHSYAEVRSLIIDWMCEVSENLKLSLRSVYHAVSILDQFLSYRLKKEGVDME